MSSMSTKIDNSRSADAMYDIAGDTFLFELNNDFNFPTTLVEVNKDMYYILSPTLGALFQGQSQETFDIGILRTK